MMKPHSNTCSQILVERKHLDSMMSTCTIKDVSGETRLVVVRDPLDVRHGRASMRQGMVRA